jgi:hypothetical protein
METDTLPRAARDRQTTLTTRLAAFLRQHPNCWIDGLDLARIGGAYAWRSRISGLRRSPFLMQIENRQRRVRGSARTVTVSEYRYVPGAAASTDDRPLLEVAESRCPTR